MPLTHQGLDPSLVPCLPKYHFLSGLCCWSGWTLCREGYGSGKNLCLLANSKAEDFWEKTEIQTYRRKKSQPYILLRLNPLPFCNSQNQTFSFTKKIGHHTSVNAQVNPLCSQTMVRGAPPATSTNRTPRGIRTHPHWNTGTPLTGLNALLLLFFSLVPN